MNQSFKYSSPNSKENIQKGIKTYTTRIETEYRKKCNKGDLMYCFKGEGYFYKTELKFAIALVLDTHSWNQKIIKKLDGHQDQLKISPFNNLCWKDFAYAEGFDNLNQLVDYFSQKRYENVNLKTFHFKVGILIRINKIRIKVIV